MRTFLISTAVIGMSAFALHCGDDASSTCNGAAECSSPTPDGDAGGTDGSSGGTDGGVPIPPGCDPTADAKDAPKCVVNEFGVFVDAAKGNDGNSGSKELPMKTIGGALGKLNGKSRVYVCEGTYAESVKVTSAVSIYGGFACADWSYSGVAAKVAPAAGYALHVEKIATGIVVSDLAFGSPDAVEAGASSVAVFVSESSVTLRRVEATANAGKDAADAAPPPTNMYTAIVADLDGNAATGLTGGGAKTCGCKVHGSSAGGKGGDSGNPAPGGTNGTSVPAATPMPPRTSAGGDGYNNGTGACFVGKPGPDGDARSGGAGAAKLGLLTAEGWVPGAGDAGEAGNPGAGGGGGGGGISNGSGGGGCGGCGGSGGVGGTGGGASVAVLAFQARLRLEGVKLTSAAAGKGASGSGGEAGGAGGGGGAAGACGGGRGGNGAGGSGGGGGAGGVSAGILRAGGSIEGTPEAIVGAKGAPGGFGGGGAGGTNALGTAPAGAPGTAGIDGQANAVVDLGQ